MMFFLLGLSIVLATLLTFNSLASFLSSLVWRSLGKSKNWECASSRAHIVFLLRILPVASGVVFVTLLLAPAYLEHEPRNSHEAVSLKLALIAIASAVGLALAVFRGIAAWRATSQLTSDWLRHSEPIELPQLGIPAFRMDHQFPVIAIVGVLRPRLFIANQILDSLAPAELAAAIQHETGHVVAYDNLKRGLIRACRDVLVMIPCGRLLDRAWVEASEAAADEFAAERGGQVALDLASALVKIARLVPAGARPVMPAGAYLVDSDEVGGLKTRVRRLMELAAAKGRGRRTGLISKVPLWIPIGLTVLVAAIAANEPHVLATVHWLMEHGVYLLD